MKLGMISALVASMDFQVPDPATQNKATCNVSYFDDLADLDVGDVGELTIGDLEEMGAFGRGRGGRAGRGRNRGGRGRGAMAPAGSRGIPARALLPRVPGVPANGVRLQPLGFGASAFTASSGNIIALQAQPQRPFKGMRLVVDLTRTGTTATGLVTITRLDVGTVNQLVSAGAISATAFAPNSYDTNLQLDPATPGIIITLQFNISAVPTSTDRVDFGATLMGVSVG
jgi:hypothetical protein